jgi:hypothetical protein
MNAHSFFAISISYNLASTIQHPIGGTTPRPNTKNVSGSSGCWKAQIAFMYDDKGGQLPQAIDKSVIIATSSGITPFNKDILPLIITVVADNKQQNSEEM